MIAAFVPSKIFRAFFYRSYLSRISFINSLTTTTTIIPHINSISAHHYFHMLALLLPVLFGLDTHYCWETVSLYRPSTLV